MQTFSSWLQYIHIYIYLRIYSSTSQSFHVYYNEKYKNLKNRLFVWRIWTCIYLATVITCILKIYILLCFYYFYYFNCGIKDFLYPIIIMADKEYFITQRNGFYCFQIERNLIVVTVFPLILNQTEFRLVHDQNVSAPGCVTKKDM